MKICHIASCLSKRAGGIPEVIWPLAENMEQLGAKVTVAGLRDNQTNQDLAWHNIETYLAKSIGPQAVGFSLQLRKFLDNNSCRFDLLHSHTTWMMPGYEARRICEKHNKPLVISTHGMLEPWCMNRSSTKKNLVKRAYADQNIKSAACLHATGYQEAENIRRHGYKNPIAVIPIGLNVNEYDSSTDRIDIDMKWNILKGKKIVLFMSRVHPKKGLLHLADAWSTLCRKYDDWHLVIAGPDQNGHTQEIRNAFKKTGADRRTLFTGPVYSKIKRQLLAAADLFVLPTYSENFGIVIAEALASAAPVITTNTTPWNMLEEKKCGWYIDIGSDPLTRAMSQALGMTDSQRQAMGNNGRQFIASAYSWQPITSSMMDVYSWCLGKANIPDCVIMN